VAMCCKYCVVSLYSIMFGAAEVYMLPVTLFILIGLAPETRGRATWDERMNEFFFRIRDPSSSSHTCWSSLRLLYLTSGGSSIV
jgi:hypothetical protein